MSSQCPKCGYVGTMGKATVGRTPTWVLELKSIACARGPIFGGLIERDVWREDATLVRFLGEGWIERAGGRGFRITPKGREAYAELARQYNLPASGGRAPAGAEGWQDGKTPGGT